MFGKYARFAACLGIATTIAACHQSEAPDPIGSKVHENVVVALNSTRTLVIKLNGNGASAASVRYAGTTGTRSGNTVTFENAAVSGTVNVSGTGLVGQSFTVDFGERSSLVIEVNAVKASTNIVSNTVAEGGSNVDNDSNNQTETGVTGTLNLGTNGSVPNYSGTDGNTDYSVVVYTPAAAPVSTTEVGQPYTRAPYSVDCQPAGATFTPAAHMEVEIPGVSEIGDEGILFQYSGTNENAQDKSVNGNIVSGNLPHFSAWNVVVSAQCTGITESSDVIATGSLTNGANTITYDEKCGFQSDVTGILSVWLKLLYGASYTTVKKTTSITATGTGSYTILQKVYTVSFKAGRKNFQVKTYGVPTCNVTYTGTEVPDTKPVVPDVPVHNGGSND